MKMIFLFKVLSPEDENFERDYEISYDSTLLDLHDLIAKDLKFKEDEMASIFLSDANWSKLQEFTSEDMGFDEEESDMEELIPMYMGDVVLGQLMQDKHQRMLYVFDIMSNRGVYVELIKSFKSKEDIYPRTKLSNSVAPQQIIEDSVGEEVSEMFDDMYEDEYEDMYEDSYEDSKDIY